MDEASLEVQDSAPAVSLIIGTRNRPALVLDAVRSILTGDSLPAEILILDQSDQESTAVASIHGPATCRIRYVWSHRRGLSRANNEGVRLATHNILVFTHDDVLVAPGWLDAIVRAQVQAGTQAIVTGQVRPTGTGVPGSFVPTVKMDRHPAVYRGRLLQDVLYPLNMALYRSAMEAIGAFDERLGPGTPFPAAEDNDFAFRALEAGYAIHYAPEAIVFHRDWRGPQDYLSTRWAYGRGQGAFYAKYLWTKDGHMRRRFARDVWGKLAQALRLARRDQRKAAGCMIYAMGLVSGAVDWIWRTGGRP